MPNSYNLYLNPYPFAMWSLFKPAAPRAVITHAQLTDIIVAAMEAAGVELQLSGTVFLADKAYSLMTDQEAFKAVRDSQTFYIPGLSDCDDTTIKAKARIVEQQGRGKFGSNPACFGILWTTRHAVNIYVNDKRQLLLLDNDATVKRPSWITGPVRLVLI